MQEMVNTRMPFGRYQDTLLCNLPVTYLETFDHAGYPSGKLGLLLQSLYEIKSTGLEHLLDRFKPAA